MMENMIKAKLAKPCPCCGSRNVKMDNPEWIAMYDIKCASIECDNCGLQITGYAGYDYVTKEDVTIQQAYRKALTRWNRRVVA